MDDKETDTRDSGSLKSIPQPIPCLRVVYEKADDTYLYVISQSGELLEHLRVVKATFCESFKATLALLWKSATLHLLQVEITTEKIVKAEAIVLIPDYLIDISALAETYKTYGASPESYILQRMMRIGNVAPLLLGNFANLFLDEWIHAEQELSYREVMQKAFRNYALELATCPELLIHNKEQEFFQNCRLQYLNIQSAVQTMKSSSELPFSVDDAVLEPAYICTALGMQGRLDYMQRDMSAFIEMKSGKADEFSCQGNRLPQYNHRIQMLLYKAVLNFSMQQGMQNQQAYLLYSRYPWFYTEREAWHEIKGALDLRNQIVAHDYLLQQSKDYKQVQAYYERLTPALLNKTGETGRLWKAYQRPQLEEFLSKIHRLGVLEKRYFYTLKAFIAREFYRSKVGETKENLHSQCSSALWTQSFETKTKEGDILYDLTLATNHAADQIDPHLILTLPQYPVDFMPNFRTGDIVVLYIRNTVEDTVSNNMIFKGSLASLTSKQLIIRLRAAQVNPKVLPETAKYAVEHDFSDASFHLMEKGIYDWATANKDRKELLLGTRIPATTQQYQKQIETAKDDFERIAYKSLAAKDYFLLVGPPGTGKTSRALKRIVEIHLENPKTQLLLLSYTNRAVDEICKTLVNLSPALPFIRLGNELTCAADFRDDLLEKKIGQATSREQVRNKLLNYRLFVGTVAYVSNKTNLFQLKHFDAAIIDEATQILEPQLLGLLSAKDKRGNNAIDKFIMIGDHKQLPAVVLQERDETTIENPDLHAIELTNLSDSLFERLYRLLLRWKKKESYDMLNKQGRMHPEVAKYANELFYNSGLQSVGLAHQRASRVLPTKAGTAWTEVLQSRVAFLEVNNPSLISIKNNAAEAEVVAALAFAIYKEYKNDFNSQKTLGIITPYRSQIALIQRELVKYNIPVLNNVVIDSVERYQGSERDIILYSFCLNKLSQLSLLSSCLQQEGTIVDRKLNVALTRARKQMFLIGNDKMLKHSKLFKRLINKMPLFTHEKVQNFTKKTQITNKKG
jgi:DNA polymerase III delta prime subunit